MVKDAYSNTLDKPPATEEEKDEQQQYDWYQEDNQIETVTPFTIINQTNHRFKIV